MLRDYLHARHPHTCFFNLKTLNRSKSERLCLFSLCSRLFAHALSFHFFSTSVFSHAFATAPLPAARGNFAMTIGVTMRLFNVTDWRGTSAFSFFDGPSTNACSECQARQARRALVSRRTRLWSIISTMAAKRPVYWPWVKSTTRPTSTNLHCEALTSISAFSAIPAVTL